MGFRCLKCRQDFGKDKVALSEHIAICTGAQKDTIEKVLIDTSEYITKCIMTNSMIDNMKSEGTE